MSDVVDFTKRRRQRIVEQNPLGPDGDTWVATVARETHDITAKGHAYVDGGDFIEEHLAKEAAALRQIAETVANIGEALSAVPPGYYIRIEMEVRAIADDALRSDECFLDEVDVGVAATHDP